jgi:hypothetical protein
MTVVALWYREHENKLKCAADTRFSRGRDEKLTITTDSGPKIFAVPVICREERANPLGWPVTHSHSFGFAYSGAVVPALSAFALASACTQSLTCAPGKSRPVSIESVGKLFRTVALHCIADASSRLGQLDDLRTHFFAGLIFGYCPVRLEYTAYKFEPSLDSNSLTVTMEHLPIGPNFLYVMGSGAKEFLAAGEKRKETTGFYEPIKVLKTMLGEETRQDVGGYIQFGESGVGDFRILPVIEPNDSNSAEWPVTFLGWDFTGADEVSGYKIGYNAVAFDEND